MRLEGRLTKEGNWWLVECDALQMATQAKTKNEALEMAKDWVWAMIGDYKISIGVELTGKDTFALAFEDPKPIIGLMIEQLRSSSNMTMDELAKALGLKSRSNIKTMTSGKHDVRFGNLNRALDALGYDVELRLAPKKDKPA